MRASQPTDKTSDVLKKTYSIKVLGVGGAGCNAVGHLARETLPGVSFLVMNTDAPALAQCPVEHKIVLGTKTTRGLGAGGDPERGRLAAEEELDTLRTACTGADIIFVVAGMGGGTGTGASPVIAQAAKETGALVLAVVVLPFDCEGLRRQRQAQLGLHQLKTVADGVISLPNQKIFKLVDEKTSLLEAFDITNELVAQGVRGIWQLLSRPGLINVDFADLCAVTQGRHSESALANAEARGENRAREVVEKLLAHPLVDNGQALADAAGILVCIAGGPDLTLTEVNRIMEQINRHGEQAHVIMGASVLQEMGDRLAVTLVASRRDGAVTAIPASPAVSLAPASTRGETPEASASSELTNQLVENAPRPASRFVAPPPPLTPERTEQLYSQQNGGAKGRKGNNRMRQAQLPLEIVSKGRFEKSEPTIHHGQDLDVPTYIRRGVALN